MYTSFVDKQPIYDSIIFDLDGTLWDTSNQIAIGWNRVLKRNSIHYREITASDIRNVTGLPHAECVQKTFEDLSDEERNFLIQETEIEDNKIIQELGGELYSNVKEGLRELSRYCPLFIVSNCQSGYIETFFKWSGLKDVFKDFECWGNTKSSKKENILSIIKRNNLKNSAYIGDTETDQQAAREASIPFIYVSYGFGYCNQSLYSFDCFLGLTNFLLNKK